MINYYTIINDDYYFEPIGAERVDLNSLNDSNFSLFYADSPIYKINFCSETVINAISKKPKNLSISFSISMNSGKLICDSTAVSILQNECMYLIYVKNSDDVYLVKRDILRLKNDVITTTIYNNQVTNINVATNKQNFAFSFDEICECDVTSTLICGCAYVIVTAEKATEKELTIFFVGDKINTIMSAVADDFIWSNEYLIKSEKLHDMQGRVKKSYYRLMSKGAEFVKNEFAFGSRFDYVSKLMIYDFLDAIRAEDYEYASQKVTAELVDGLPSLKEFIGEIKDVITPEKIDEKKTHIKVIVKEKILTIKKLIFELSGDKICNIEIETN